MSANAATKQRSKEVRIGIPLVAFLRFGQQIDEQLKQLERRTFAAVPQLTRRKSNRRSANSQR